MIRISKVAAFCVVCGIVVHLGVTTNDIVEKDLSKIESTGVSTEPVRKAAVAFLDGLTDDLLRQHYEHAHVEAKFSH